MKSFQTEIILDAEGTRILLDTVREPPRATPALRALMANKAEDKIQRVWLIRNKKTGTYMHFASTAHPGWCASDQEIVEAFVRL